MEKSLGIIVTGGMGGFLDAPTYPTHTHHVTTDFRRKKENRGGMNLDYALGVDYLNDETKEKIKTLLDEWHKNKPSLDSAEVQDWILQVFGYFSGGKEALSVIKKFYPEYQLKIEHIENAYWGKKPDTK